MEAAIPLGATSDRYQLALEAAGIAIFDNDLLTNTIHFAGNGHELYHVEKGGTLTLEELIMRIHPADRERMRKKLDASLNPKLRAPYENEYRIVDPSTGLFFCWVRARGRVYFTENNIPYRFTGTIQDVTAEIRTRETEQKLLALVDNSIELMSILEANGVNSYINKAGMEMLGFESREQVLTTPISELHAPEDIAFVEANVLPAVQGIGRWSGMMNVRHLKTGEIFPVYNNTVRIHDRLTGEPIAVGAVMRDMRPELAARRALEESEKNLRTLVMQAPIGICILEGEELIHEIANDSFLAITRRKREAVEGHSVWEVFPGPAAQGYGEIMLTVLRTGQPYHGREVEVVLDPAHKEDTTFFDFTYQPLYESDGSIRRLMTLAIDVTDKVLARRQLLQNEEELQRRVAERTMELERKNRELEEFTYVSSHDLQEPLRKIKMFREMIFERDYHRLSPLSQQYFDKVGASVSRMSQSLKDLLNFASLQKEEAKEPVLLDDLLQQALTDLELLIEEKGALIEAAPLPAAQGIPHQLKRLFYNLVNNSLKFTRSGIVPVIRISAGPATPESCRQQGLIPEAGPFLHLRVEDNGIGFEPDKAERIFGLFQRLHGRHEYEGTGIGLALCRKVAINHGGALWAEVRPGEGASFHLLLPVDAS
jgi:PAS domain S-box-containing protein